MLRDDDARSVIKIAKVVIDDRNDFAHTFPGAPLPNTCRCVEVTSDPSILRRVLQSQFGNEVALTSHEYSETKEVWSGGGGTDTVDETRTWTEVCVFAAEK